MAKMIITNIRITAQHKDFLNELKKKFKKEKKEWLGESAFIRDLLDKAITSSNKK